MNDLAKREEALKEFAAELFADIDQSGKSRSGEIQDIYWDVAPVVGNDGVPDDASALVEAFTKINLACRGGLHIVPRSHDVFVYRGRDSDVVCLSVKAVRCK